MGPIYYGPTGGYVIRFLSFTLFIVWSSVAVAQEPTTDVKADQEQRSTERSSSDVEAATLLSAAEVLFKDPKTRSDGQNKATAALRLLDRPGRTPDALLGRALHQAGNGAYFTNDIPRAETLWRRALTVREQSLGRDHPDVAKTLNNLAILYDQRDNFAKAIPLYQRQLELRRKRLGARHPDVADLLHTISTIFLKTNKFKRAQPLIEESLAIREAALGPEHPSVAESLTNLATLHDETGAYDRALPLYLKSLKIREKVLGRYHPAVARSLNNLGILYNRTGDYRSALTMFNRNLEIREREAGAQHPSVAKALVNISEVYSKLGDYASAINKVERSLTILEKALGKEHPHVGIVTSQLANLRWKKGDYAVALPFFLRSLSIFENAHGENHPRVAQALNRLAIFYDDTGRYTEAEPLYLRSIKIFEKVFGPEHPSVSWPLNNLAVLRKKLGQFDRALPLYQRSLAITEKTKGKEHPSVGRVLNNIALLYRSKGDPERALPLYERAIAVYKKSLGPEHPRVAETTSNLAVLYQNADKTGRALELHELSLAMREKTLGAQHPDVASSLINIATLAQEDGKSQRALELLQRGLGILESALGREHPDVAETLINLAVVQRSLGEKAHAIDLVSRALTIYEKSYGTEHPAIANALSYLALIHAETTPSKAVQFQDRAVSIISNHLRRNLGQGTQREQSLFLATAGAQLVRTLTLARRFKLLAADKVAIRAVLDRKGLALEAGALRIASVRSNLDPERRALMVQLAAARKRLARLSAATAPSGKALDAWRRQRIEVAQRVAAVEEKLASTSTSFAEQLRVPMAQTVTEKLKSQEVVIDWVIFIPDSLDKTARTETEQQLAAVVYRSDRPPSLHFLGALTPIKVAIESLGRAIKARGDYRPLSSELYDLLIKPFEAELSEAERLTLSPDGPLNFVPFGALVDKRGRHLVERFTIRYVTSPRELLAARQSNRRVPAPPLVLADANFDATGEQSSQADDTKPSSMRSADMNMAPFRRLPGTRREALAIAPVLAIKADRLLLQDGATETALKNAHGPSVLHIATHGFFLPNLTARHGRSTDTKNASATARLEDPMLRSGLALAGFNARGSARTEDDGVLTATEVAGLDLQGTELVVLSACETGLGKTKNGEGVYGLKRAMALAGALTTAVTLWKVDDDATAALMSAYYVRLKSGQDRVESLRQVQIDMLSGRLTATDKTATDQRGATVATSEGAAPTTGQGWRHPYYWASFTLSGADGPIQLEK